MSMQSDDPDEKGFFHRATGVPFWPTITGNRSTYQSLDRQLELAENKKKQQMKIQRNLARQKQELALQKSVLEDEIIQSKEDISTAEIQRRNATEALEKVEFDGPFSMQPRTPGPKDLARKVLSFVPYVGTAATAYQVKTYYDDKAEAESNLEIENQAVLDIQEFSARKQDDLKQKNRVLNQVKQDLDAQIIIVNGLQTTTKNLQTQRDEL